MNMGTHTVLINIDLNPSSQMFKEFLFICISLTPEQAVNFGGASNDAEKTVKQKLDVSITRASKEIWNEICHRAE